MGSSPKMDPKSLKKAEAEAQKKIDSVRRKYPVPADATPAEIEDIKKKIAKEISMK